VKRAGAERRILALTYGDPWDDPRIRWASDLCAEYGKTVVVGALPADGPIPREYDGRILVERFNSLAFASWSVRSLIRPMTLLYRLPPARRFADPTGAVSPSRWRIVRFVGGVLDFIADWASYSVLISGLRRFTRGVSVPPDLVVCHDIYSLPAAVDLKRRHGTRVLYDSHEYWPHADTLSTPWMSAAIARYERRLLRNVDAIVTVSPPIARALERDYRIPHVGVVPNAEPLPDEALPAVAAPHDPVRFLIQGGAARGRGFEVVLEAWRKLSDVSAVLIVRCPENAYLASLRERYDDLVAAGRVEFPAKVAVSELVKAAASADVGIIPYVGPNLNHLYCCPNKLSQYMQAGLAVLANDLEYVAQVIRQYDCGAVYVAERPETLIATVRELVENPAGLAELKTNARAAALDHFNWAEVSGPYRDALEQLLGVTAT
jgi:glycosyltransferase involved in cell wall biosynthesis